MSIFCILGWRVCRIQYHELDRMVSRLFLFPFSLWGFYNNSWYYNSNIHRRIFRLQFIYNFVECSTFQRAKSIFYILYFSLSLVLSLLLKDQGNDTTVEVINNYHMKTVMMWACELKPASWWNSKNIFVTCCSLIKSVLNWLKLGFCQHYFIRTCNLFKANGNNEQLMEKLEYATKLENLIHWFKLNYIESTVSTKPEQSLWTAFDRNLASKLFRIPVPENDNYSNDRSPR